MERIKRLSRYPKAVLLCLATMVLAFAAAYAVTTARVGLAYKGAIFVPSQENGGTVYSGKLEGSPASFTVYDDQTVEFRCGDAMYGPYTAKQAPDAVPQEYAADESVTGVELFCAQELIFRGGAARWGDRLVLFNEDGTMADIGISVRASDGVSLDENGSEIDPLEPSAYAILELMAGPALTHKGAWPVWLAGVFVCAVTAVLILFADELFRWRMALRLRNADGAEPSELELMDRYVSWTVLPVLALVLFFMGLQ